MFGDYKAFSHVAVEFFSETYDCTYETHKNRNFFFSLVDLESFCKVADHDIDYTELENETKRNESIIKAIKEMEHPEPDMFNFGLASADGAVRRLREQYYETIKKMYAQEDTN
jgi:hypothetical protein